jgi:hypothetical protein
MSEISGTALLPRPLTGNKRELQDDQGNAAERETRTAQGGVLC